MALKLLFFLSFVIFDKFTNVQSFQRGHGIKKLEYAAKYGIRSNQHVYSENYTVFYVFMSFEVHFKKKCI